MSGSLVNTLRDLYEMAQQNMPSRFEAEELFFHITSKRGYDMPAHGDEPATDRQRYQMEALIERRNVGEPLQYLLRQWEFYGLPFFVGSGVLIPRADTETLVDQAVELLDGMSSPEVVDLCSGSGCVAIAVAHCVPSAAVTALEVSEKAFGYLERNVELNLSSVVPVQGDLYSYIHPRPIDLITANPPYIPRGALAGLQREVQREPAIALDGGMDGLEYIRAIARRYLPRLRPGGWLCMEIGIDQDYAATQLLTLNGYVNTGSRNDLSGIPRVVFGQRPL